MNSVVPHNCVEPLQFRERKVMRQKLKYSEARNGLKVRVPRYSRIVHAWIDTDGELSLAIESNSHEPRTEEIGIVLVGHGNEVPLYGRYLTSMTISSKRIGSVGSVTKHLYVV